MTPARRKSLLRLKNGGRKRSFLRTLLILFLTVGIFAFLTINTKVWHSGEKTSIVINSAKGDIVIMALDPDNKSLTNIIIPAETELDVARQLGSWRAKSIWKLGENEKAGGALLRETIVKNFRFPVIGWADSLATGFADGEFLAVLKAIAFPYKSNLTLADKIRFGIYSLRVNTASRNEINLTESKYLRKVKLKDGGEGFILSGKIPKELLLVFSEPQFAQKGLKVNIKDATGNTSVAVNLGETIEVLGAKVAAVTRLSKSDIDCRVSGSAKDLVSVIGEIFSCKVISVRPQGNFDVEIEIGEAFAKRY